MDVPRNMTGLYLGGFVQEGYLPPRERKSTIPSTLYRGHVVKLARAPNSNPHRSSVGRYPMHSLNSGFSGLKVPIKDQMYYKSPEEPKRSRKPKGKWTNYPMSIEIRKIAGNGASGAYLAECVLNGVRSSVDNTPDNIHSPTSRAGSSLFGATPTFRDKDEERFYQSMYDEIRQVVSHQEDALVTSRHRLQRILLNDSENSIRPDVVSPAHEPKRVATSYGFSSQAFTPALAQLPKRPHTTSTVPKVKQGSLLLPVPFVSKHAWGERRAHDTDADKSGSVSPLLPRVTPALPYSQKLKDFYRDDRLRWNSPEPALPRHHGNIGVSAAERLNRLLSAAAEEESQPPTISSERKEEQIDVEMKPVATNLTSSQTPTGQHSSLSVVVPATYEEPPSLSCSPLPPQEVAPAHIPVETSAKVATKETTPPKITTISPKVTNVQLIVDGQLDERNSIELETS